MDPCIVRMVAYAEGRPVALPDLEEIGAWSRRPGHFVWVGLNEPGAERVRQLQSQLGLHPLAVEDALKAHQRPKLETYGEGIFVVLRTAALVGGVPVFGEAHIFAGRGYVVTVRHGAARPFAPVREECEAQPSRLRHGEDFVLHALLDFVVDGFMPVLEAMEAEIAPIEDKVTAHVFDQQSVDRLYVLRRDLARLRRVVAPLVEVTRSLERLDLPMIDAEMRPYFRDVTDHALRVVEQIDALREVLTFTFEASLMLSAASQNEVTRKFAGWAAILAVPTAIAGIYGMNFDVMPELRWRYGYFVVLGVIALVCLELWRRFRRAGWL
jgi:magnesium transporter